MSHRDISFSTLRNSEKIFKNEKLDIFLLVSSTSKKEKETILKKLKQERVDILIATHTILSKNVCFNNLSLVVVDESQRFGVEQISKLSQKGKDVDMLMMSATPIPRSYASILLKVMNVSRLQTYFPKEKNIHTLLVFKDDESFLQNITKALKQEKLVYIVCPYIDADIYDEFSLYSLFSYYNSRFKDLVALLHGRLNEKEKKKALDDFITRKKPILISTTMVEVGIDIPDADLMIIYSANKFGLSTLHQLRGRIGRRSGTGTCFLVVDSSIDQEKLNPLRYFKNSSDGEEIANFDLRYRGQGDLYSTKQSGFLNFLYLDIDTDIKIFSLSYQDALKSINDGEIDSNDFLIYKQNY